MTENKENKFIGDMLFDIALKVETFCGGDTCYASSILMLMITEILASMVYKHDINIDELVEPLKSLVPDAIKSRNDFLEKAKPKH